MEGGRGADRHPSMCKPPFTRRLTGVHGGKRDREGYSVVGAFSRAYQNRPRPPLPGIPGPKEFI